ncbi:glycosyltransferase family 2 protein [Amycolatopsis sp. SID8362]|uniref:glycosyltransferase family 2 protein n=1 Tax=Amycolatopsis sp. SID8362 TaxID=2690346 RepID=UPI00281541D7|nr:glycosyltransferase family 2 protein [Amycolatopsis sp. SID8362]
MEKVNKVAAVVVTYNRKDKLGKVLESILAQSCAPEWVVVVDNASTDGTDELLASYETDRRITVLRLPENTGGAGGFSAGMTKAYEMGADFLWIMDDDCYPRPDALEELVNGLDKAEQTLGQQLPFACSVVKWTDGGICEMNNPGTTWDWGRLLSLGQQAVLVNHCSFVSVLVPRRTVTRFGLPLTDYFIWFDDMEYTLRVSQAGPGLQVLTSVVVHDLPVNQGVNFGLVTNQNVWKYEYGARNEFSYRLHHESAFAAAGFAGRVLRGMAQGHVSPSLRLRVVKSLVRGVKFNPKPRFPHSVL